MITVLKTFLKNFIYQKNYQTVEKKQLLIILPFLGYLSFETRNRLNSCIKSQLPSTFLLYFSSKPVYLAYLNSKAIFLNTFVHISFIDFRIVAARQRIMVKLRDTFLYERQSIWELLHWHRNGLKIPRSLPLWTIFH